MIKRLRPRAISLKAYCHSHERWTDAKEFIYLIGNHDIERLSKRHIEIKPQKKHKELSEISYYDAKRAQHALRIAPIPSATCQACRRARKGLHILYKA